MKTDCLLNRVLFWLLLSLFFYVVVVVVVVVAVVVRALHWERVVVCLLAHMSAHKA